MIQSVFQEYLDDSFPSQKLLAVTFPVLSWPLEMSLAISIALLPVFSATVLSDFLFDKRTRSANMVHESFSCRFVSPLFDVIENLFVHLKRGRS